MDNKTTHNNPTTELMFDNSVNSRSAKAKRAKRRGMGLMSLALLALVAGLPQVGRAQNLVSNGGFETLTDIQTGTASTEGGFIGAFNDTNGNWVPMTTANGWTSTGFSFAFLSGRGDSTGAPIWYGQPVADRVKMWGPANGVNNGLSDSPSGGNYVTLDGGWEPGFISQTISGLTINKQYQLSFQWAGAQMYGYDGDTTDELTVSLGSQSQVAGVLSIPEHTFSGWMTTTMVFTATANTETLTFANSATTGVGLPPFLLLDGVSLTAVPEPGSPLLLGAAAVFGLLRRRRPKA